MNKFTMEVNTKENGKYKKVGDVTIFYPLLSEFGFAVEPKKFDEETGLPEYESESVQFLFDSVFNSAKADARNKLVGGTATLKDGASIAESLEDLIAVAARDGAAIKAFREMLNAFKEYLASDSGKASNVQAAILALASNKKTLALQPAGIKTKFQAYLVDFAGKLSTEQASTFERSLSGLNNACQEVDLLDQM